jgi:O-antigen/teichoic acid export membrane protein
MAVWGSGGYLACILVGIWFLHSMGLLNAFSAFLLMAFASIPAAVVLLWRLGVMGKKLATSVPWKQVLTENWTYGRWLVASTVLFTIGSQIQTYFAAAFLGLEAAGILRAMQIPSLVMAQIVTAVGLMALPAMAQDFGLGEIDRLRKKAVLATLSLTGVALVYVGILAICAAPLNRALFGGKFSSNSWLIPVLGLVPVFTAFATGFSMALRAVRRPHFDLVANMVSAPIGLVTALTFIRIWGLGGAALSMVAGFGGYSLVFFFSFRRWTAEASLLSAGPGELPA